MRDFEGRRGNQSESRFSREKRNNFELFLTLELPKSYLAISFKFKGSKLIRDFA